MKVNTKRCPECGVQVPEQQINRHGKCERHLTSPDNDDSGNPEDDEVEHGISIIDREWKPKVVEENFIGRD